MFEMTWSKPDGRRGALREATAMESVNELLARGLWEAPGLKIKDAGGASLSKEALSLLAAQQDDD